MTKPTHARASLEPAAAKLCSETCGHPRIYELPPPEGRAALEALQKKTKVEKLPAELKTFTFDCLVLGRIHVQAFIPSTLRKDVDPEVIFYVHGGGWVFGSPKIHDKLCRELAHKSKSIVLCPEYSTSPEAHFPTAIHQLSYVLEELPHTARENGWSLKKFTIAGDSVGGGMAAVLTNTFKNERIPKIHKQLLFYPVLDAKMNTASYEAFADGYYLTKDAMKWYWDQYTQIEADRMSPLCSPLHAESEELKGVPPTMIINADVDVLRDEGIAYAHRLQRAGVDVQNHIVPAIIHDFVMLNCLDQTVACRNAMEVATEWINKLNQV